MPQQAQPRVKSPNPRKPVHLPRLVPRPDPEPKIKSSSLSVNIGASEFLKTNVVSKYEHWLYPGLSQTRFDGFDSCCRSSVAESSASSSGRSLCRRIPNIQELITLLFAPDDKSLIKWKKTLAVGKELRIENVQDELIQSQVLRIMGKADGSVSIRTPRLESDSLGITLPYLNMIIRNLDCYFSFEIQILDNMGIKRLFQMSNFQSLVRIKTESCSMPMRLDSGWNQVILELPSFVKDAFGTRYQETIRIKINANIYVRRIYFSSDLFDELTLPAEYKIFPLGDLDKRPVYRDREDLDEIEFGLNDIVVPKIQSSTDLVNSLFETASGYIEITEENWDQPKLIMQKAGPGMNYPPHRKALSPHSTDSGESIDSLKVYSSLDARHRIKSFIQGTNLSPSKHHVNNSKLFDEPSDVIRHSTPNVADLLEDLSEVYEFLATVSSDLIPKASAETVEDLQAISESLRDMASFSGIFQNKLMSSKDNIPPKEKENKDKDLGILETIQKNNLKTILSKSKRSTTPRLADREEVIISFPGHEPNQGLALHVSQLPGAVDDSEPSMQILNLSLGKQVLAHVQLLERPRPVLQDVTPEFGEPEPEHHHATSKKSQSKSLDEGSPGSAQSCLDFAMKSYAGSTKSLKEFASLSSDLLEKLGGVSQFTDTFTPSWSSVKSKTSSHDTLIHLRKLSLALKEIGSVSSIEAIRQNQMEKAAPVVDSRPPYDVFEHYNEIDPPDFKGSVEIFKSFSSDCCLVKNEPPFLARHTVPPDEPKAADGMSLFDSSSDLGINQTHIMRTSIPIAAGQERPPDEEGISTKFIKLIRNLSADMVKNFSTESLLMLSESGSLQSNFALNLNLDNDSQNLLTGFSSEHELEKCSKFKDRREFGQMQQQVESELEDQVSSQSLKYLPSTSSTRVTPNQNAQSQNPADNPDFSVDDISRYEMMVTFDSENNTMDKIEPFLDYDAIPCESWHDFFLPARNCEDNIGGMSDIWNKFGTNSDTFPVGFALKSTPNLADGGAGAAAGADGAGDSKCSSISGGSAPPTVYSNSSSDTHCTKLSGQVQFSTSFTNIHVPVPTPRRFPGKIHSNVWQFLPSSHPPSKSVSSTSSLPQSVAVSEVSSKGIISDKTEKQPSFCNKLSVYEAKKLRRKTMAKKIAERKSRAAEMFDEISPIPSSMESVSDSDTPETVPSLKQLKKFCLEALKKPPDEFFFGAPTSIIPSDHGFWSPTVQTSNSDSDSDFSPDEQPVKCKFPELFGPQYSEDDTCSLSGPSSSRQTLNMMSAPCSAGSSISEPTVKVTTPTRVESEDNRTETYSEGSVMWSYHGDDTPPLSSSSNTSSESSYDEMPTFEARMMAAHHHRHQSHHHPHHHSHDHPRDHPHDERKHSEPKKVASRHKSQTPDANDKIEPRRSSSPKAKEEHRKSSGAAAAHRKHQEVEKEKAIAAGTDLTTILAPDLSEASLFQQKKADRKMTRSGGSKHSISGLTESTDRLLHGQPKNQTTENEAEPYVANLRKPKKSEPAGPKHKQDSKGKVHDHHHSLK